ncbi:MAG: hypothetical protein IJ412_10920 [Oscillospiraceae bacterium]|nr:hypothetical protein [Oscillospiraceae bacterium]
MIVPRYFENPAILHENTMPDRAYYVPAACRMQPDAPRTESARLQLLNGIGSHSCGPALQPQYRLDDPEMRLCVLLWPE